MFQSVLNFNEPQFVCPTCNERFHINNQLQRHQLTHARIVEFDQSRIEQQPQVGSEEDSDDEAGVSGTISLRELELENRLDQETHNDEGAVLQEVEVIGARFSFRNKMHQLFYEFYNQLNADIPQSMLESVIDLSNKVVDIVEGDRNAKVPAFDLIINPEKRKDNKIPFLEVTEHEGQEKRKDGNKYTIKTFKFSMIKISAMMALLVFNPDYTDEIYALPDYSDGLSTSTNGRKWREIPIFQHPMTVVQSENGVDVDYWVGYLVQTFDGRLFVLSKFYTVNQTEKMADVYRVTRQHPNIFVYHIGPSPVHIRLDTIDSIVCDDLSVISTAPAYPINMSIDARRPLLDIYTRLVSKNPLQKDDESGRRKYLRVKVAPINIFTDDMSGNTTKKFNKVDNWSFVPAALM